MPFPCTLVHEISRAVLGLVASISLHRCKVLYKSPLLPCPVQHFCCHTFLVEYAQRKVWILCILRCQKGSQFPTQSLRFLSHVCSETLISSGELWEPDKASSFSGRSEPLTITTDPLLPSPSKKWTMMYVLMQYRAPLIASSSFNSFSYLAPKRD